MSRTYKATGINLKSMVLGESDRLVTILTPELGLIRAVAPGARKHNSSLSGRSGMFVVNELLIAKGRSLDKITQAQTLKTYPGLSQDLGKLAASQYLAEMVLTQALSDQPQEELYELLNEHLSRLQQLPNTSVSVLLAHLTHAVFHLLALAGVTPQVQFCCLTKHRLTPNFNDPNWRVGFSVPAGGTVSLVAWESLRKQGGQGGISSLSPQASSNQTTVHQQEAPPVLSKRLNATELALLQHLCQPEITQPSAGCDRSWLAVEKLMRSYTQYHFGHQIRSAALIDTYFASMPTSAKNDDATV